MKRLAFLLLLVGSLGGCAPVNRDELAKEVLSKDPEFGAVLDKHRELSSRIQTYERELALRRSTVEKSIAQLRKDLAATAASVRVKIAEVKTRMDPDRKRLEAALEAAGVDLRAKREQRATLGREIAGLRKSAQGAGVSEQERARQETKVASLLQEAQRLDQELTSLKEQIRLLKIKLLLIKL